MIPLELQKSQDESTWVHNNGIVTDINDNFPRLYSQFVGGHYNVPNVVHKTFHI